MPRAAGFGIVLSEREAASLRIARKAPWMVDRATAEPIWRVLKMICKGMQMSQFRRIEQRPDRCPTLRALCEGWGAMPSTPHAVTKTFPIFISALRDQWYGFSYFFPSP